MRVMGRAARATDWNISRRKLLSNNFSSLDVILSGIKLLVDNGGNRRIANEIEGEYNENFERVFRRNDVKRVYLDRDAGCVFNTVGKRA